MDALLSVISAVLTLTYIYQYYLYKLSDGCDKAKEDFGKTRQQSEMFIFLFLYQIAYLAGVSSCTTLAMASDHASALDVISSIDFSHEAVGSAIGYVLLPFYVLLPVLYLGIVGKRVKGSIGGEGDFECKASLDEVQKKAAQDSSPTSRLETTGNSKNSIRTLMGTRPRH